MAKYSGLKFQKFDLHVHTPASHDFKDKTVTAKQIVDHAIAKGLRGIAITDHHTGSFINVIKNEAADKNLAVFPGVEILCTGGTYGIHIIGILDIDKNQGHIEAILSNIDIEPDKIGALHAVSPKGPYDVIDVITKAHGIAILAHCNSSKGVLHDMKGLTRTKIFENTGLLAVETSEHDFTNKEKIKLKKRVIDLLNECDPNYNYRKLGVYIASDSKSGTSSGHELKYIGSKYTYFKVDVIVTLESIRQCFIDREVRIRQYFEYKEQVYPFIKSITIKGGFFDNQTINFHEGLNSILGGKGTGKSLLIEFMRFALAQPSTQEEILEDHNRKLEKRLETYGIMELKIVDETAMEHTIERTFDKLKDNPYSTENHERIAAAFSVLFLSQNEIVKIAEDEREQIRFIDKFFDFRHYQNRLINIKRDLEQHDKKFADGLRAINNLIDIKKQIEKNKTDLDRIDKLLSDPIYDKYKSLEKKDITLRNQESFLRDIKTHINDELKIIENYVYPEIDIDIKDDPVIKRNNDTVNRTLENLSTLLNTGIEYIKKSIQTVESEYKKWNITFSNEKKEYEEHVRKSGGDRKQLEEKRIKIVKEHTDLQHRKVDLVNKTKNLKSITEQREILINKLFTIYKEYSKERSEKCKFFETESNGRLQVRIKESTNVDEFKKQLTSLKRGSYLRGKEIENICSTITPYNFIMTVLRYDATKDSNKLKPIAESTGIEIERVRVLCDFLINEFEYETILRLQYEAHPQDRPEIRFCVGSDKYELVRDISVGQKCTAMLIMALSEGNIPVVIDQPEDSLDIRSIWEDMCVKIRRSKEKRQFIFTTHNSSLAVASDTDKYTIIESDANRGTITISGAIDASEMKKEVINYLEGGAKTYQRKAEKYGWKIK